jgi:DNA-binding protein YbaB
MLTMYGFSDFRPTDLSGGLTEAERRERARECARKTEEATRAVNVEGRAEGVRLTLDGYVQLSDLEIAPELMARQDFADALVARINEAMAMARPQASYRGYVAQHVVYSSDSLSDLTWNPEEDGIWIWFPDESGDRELIAGLWYYWRQRPISLEDLAAAAELDLGLLQHLITGMFPLRDELMDHEMAWARQDLAAALGRVFEVTAKELIDRGVAICLPLDVVNLAVLLGETDSDEHYHAYSATVRYDRVTSRALWRCRELYGEAGPLETVSRAIEAGALRIDAPAPAAYPVAPRKSRWDVDYMSYPSPETVVYAEILMGELGISLPELDQRFREVFRREDPKGERIPLDLVAVVHNRENREYAYCAQSVLETIARGDSRPDATNEEDEWSFFGPRDEAEIARDARVTETLRLIYRDAYARYFLEGSPTLKLKNRQGRTWEEIGVATSEDLYRRLRLEIDDQWGKWRSGSEEPRPGSG